MDDEKIIELYWQRSEEAISETQNKYDAYIRKIALNVLNSKSLAEECANDTYFAAWNSIPPNRPKHLSAFIGKIARNKALDRYAYSKRDKRNNQFDVFLSELGDCLADNKAQDDFNEGILSESINTFLAGLPSKYRKVFIRRYWYFSSINDISKVYDINENTVKTILFRTRQALKEYLENEGFTI